MSLVVLHQARQLFCVRLLFFTRLVLMVKTDESDSESPNAQHAKLRMVDWPLKMFGENDCNRVSAKYRLPGGKYSSLDLSVTAAVVVTREKFAACYVCGPYHTNSPLAILRIRWMSFSKVAFHLCHRHRICKGDASTRKQNNSTFKRHGTAVQQHVATWRFRDSPKIRVCHDVCCW